MHPRSPNKWLRRLSQSLLVVLAVLLLAGAYLALVPPNLGALRSQADPAVDYAGALQKLAALQALDTADVNPRCATRLLTHGQPTQRVVVLIHGYTNCPEQFAELGRQFYDLGANVLIARMPHHGLADLLTDDMTNLTAEELAAHGDQLVNIAAGLGDQVAVVGLSGGGVVAGWVAQNRPEVDEAVLIAPGFGFQAIPAPVTVFMTNFTLLRPDQFAWWNPADPMGRAAQGMDYAYPRFSYHALAQLLRLGQAIRAQAGRSAPAAAGILLITNANDNMVDNAAAAQVAAAWQAHGAAVRTYEFPAELGLPHDVVDPHQPDQQIALVYPQLIALISP